MTIKDALVVNIEEYRKRMQAQDGVIVKNDTAVLSAGLHGIALAGFSIAGAVIDVADAIRESK